MKQNYHKSMTILQIEDINKKYKCIKV